MGLTRCKPKGQHEMYFTLILTIFSPKMSVTAEFIGLTYKIAKLAPDTWDCLDKSKVLKESAIECGSLCFKRKSTCNVFKYEKKTQACTLGKILSSVAKKHIFLVSEKREINYKNGADQPRQGGCDHLGRKWYRFKFPNNPFATIPTTPPDQLYSATGLACAQGSVAWMKEALPDVGGEPVKRDICFGDTEGNGEDCMMVPYEKFDTSIDATVEETKHYKVTASVVGCSSTEGVFYLYQLPNTPCVGNKKNTLYCA